MSERIIKTGLSKKYKDMLDAVCGQMSDGYWENTPMMRGYWKFCDIGTDGDEVTIEVDTTSGARDGDRRIDNRFYGMSDDAVKKFFADKIKFLIKEEGLGKWDRGNESETDYLSYGKPRYRVKDCYYAYEVLKGRNARKHPEYGDVEESRQRVKIKLVEKNESAASFGANGAITIQRIVDGDPRRFDDETDALADLIRAYASKNRSFIPAGIEAFREYQIAILQRLHGISPRAYQHAKKLILNWN